MFLVAFIAGLCLSHVSADCTFNLDTSSPAFPPHIVDATNNLVQPTLISGVRILTLAANQQVTVACEGTGNVLTATGKQFNTATCVSGSALTIGTTSYTFNQLTCKIAVKESFKEIGACENGGTIVQIGWTVGTAFINQITTCHVKSKGYTLYAIDTINGLNIAADDKSNARPSFHKGNYYTGVDVDAAYSQAGQTATLAKILGSSPLAAQYVDVSNSRYFARGHLAPDGDFIDAASQDATYYFINCLPQYQSFNNGNWKALELATRGLAINRVHSLRTYTGGFGTLTLADVNNVQQPIYLYFDANNNGMLPAPKFYWKVVHDINTNTAVAVVGINNPYLTPTAADVICPDVCDQVSWVTWNRTSIQSGYMYCCTVASLRAAVSYAPDLGDLPLLI